MAGELDGIGEAVTGAAAGRAVEPRAGEGDGHSHEVNCLNCRAPLEGPYCARCGQKAHLHRTIGAFFHDLLHGVLHFDGKTWRTLPLLLWRPGELTRRYIDGQRARFVSPLALFLFTVFIMFALLGSTVGPTEFSAPALRTDLAKARAQTSARIARIETAKAVAPAGSRERAELDRKLRDAREDLQGVEAMEALGRGGAQRADLGQLGWLRGPIERAIRNPDLLIYKVRTSAYKWSWALIPLSAPFLWLLFPFSRRFKLYDHVIFVTYSLAFMNLLLVAGMLLYLAGLPTAAALLALLPPWHFYRQLKGAYGLGVAGALWRTVALTVFALVVLVLFALLMLAVGLL